MSLTSFLKEKEVKDKFKQEFPLPKFELEKEIIAPPVTNHYILIGVAFDYLLRFYINYLNTDTITNTWIAEIAVEQLLAAKISESKPFNLTEGAQLSKLSTEEYMEKLVDTLTKRDKLFFRKLLNVLKEAKKYHKLLLKFGKISDELIESVINLARLDPIFRSRYIDPNIGVVDKKDVKDMRVLISAVNPTTFKTANTCFLNPTFGVGSSVVGGADADLIIGDTLVDIKTTKYLRFDRTMFNQLIGYYLLSRIGGVNGASSKKRIKKLGIYFSRYGELYTFDVNSVVKERRVGEYIEWLMTMTKPKYGSKD